MTLNLKCPIGIVGMGKSGLAAVRLLKTLNFKSTDFATFDDSKGKAQFSDPYQFIQTIQPKTLIVSPGYPLEVPWLINARKQNVKIINELTLASHFLKNEKLIGVTGSLGKSTVAALLAEGASKVDQNFFIGGNFGTPFCDYISDLMAQKREPASWVVLELSSYHLENLENLSFDFSAITYLTENHLERYSSKEAYYNTKWNLLNLTQFNLFLNQNGGDLKEYAQKYSNEKIIFTNKNNFFFENYNLQESLLWGQHNQDNLAVAVHISHYCRWGADSISAMKKFRGLPHRLENLGTYKGIRFINDSKSTAIKSIVAALASTFPYVSANNQIHLLVGGKDKNLPWEDLSYLVTKPNVSIYFFGQCAPIAQLKSGIFGRKYNNLKEATLSAFSQSKQNDIILLSPGGASFDEFKSFEDRGTYFKNLVQTL